MSPVLSIVMTEYFARLHRDGSPIDCGADPHDEACIAGSRQAAWLSSIFSAGGCVGNLILSPMLGQASDVYGRKPFLVLNQILRLGVPFSVMYFMQPDGSITPYFVLRLVDSGFGVAGVMSAAIADVVAPEDRAAAFGFLFASLSVGYCTSAFAAPFFSREHILQIAAALFVLRVLWAIFLLPETLPVRTHVSKTRWVVENPFRSMAILFRDQLFMRLTCLIALTAFVMNGVFQIQSFFLNTIVGFDVKDFGYLMLVGGVLALLGQVLLLKPLVSCVREKGVIVIALIANMVGTCGFVAVAYYPRKWLVYALCVPGCISDLSFPAISALKSINVSEKEQGRLQGAIYGARSIFEALGPIVFASLYASMTRDSVWSQALPYVVASFIYFVGIGVAISLPAGKNPSTSKCVAGSAPLLSPTYGESPTSMYFETDDDDDEMEDDDKTDLDDGDFLAEPLLGSSSAAKHVHIDV
ncbi:Major Facilitator Superfamily (MFS) [Phytophthora infestans T30-4]|uniref:Major Facilitator Superfamily (MFS) n=2 Tax=Phytophthora infestans TaxID=4787 RepID=D0N7F9_PHYIT|nr:Major Facilitator Superfamily (MFS) [Phytophthora infestans T30-4]EEY53508.1 Major Facilitator Superfamily (MFS) [Phytophthora infestans T30-4]|eukprot:XP_002905126.1 Major Facilitator Superfamily (MFS) [Phytophthora infestans T30-4]